MRENLFHGKRKDNGEWVEGYYCAFNGVSHRIYTGYAETDCGEFYPDYYEVIPETVGQYAVATDKNSTKILREIYAKSQCSLAKAKTNTTCVRCALTAVRLSLGNVLVSTFCPWIFMILKQTLKSSATFTIIQN